MHFRSGVNPFEPWSECTFGGDFYLRWERINKRGAPPSKRIGSSMVVHKGRYLSNFPEINLRS